MNKRTDNNENPEWTEDDFRKAKPPHDILPVKSLAGFPNTRGPQKAATKVPVSIRLNREVVNFYKAKGKGWQSCINEDLKKLAGL